MPVFPPSPPPLHSPVHSKVEDPSPQHNTETTNDVGSERVQEQDTTRMTASSKEGRIANICSFYRAILLCAIYCLLSCSASTHGQDSTRQRTTWCDFGGLAEPIHTRELSSKQEPDACEALSISLDHTPSAQCIRNNIGSKEKKRLPMSFRSSSVHALSKVASKALSSTRQIRGGGTAVPTTKTTANQPSLFHGWRKNKVAERASVSESSSASSGIPLLLANFGEFFLLFFVSSLSCLSTWVCIHHRQMSPLRVSCMHGLVASVMGVPPSLAAACLSGAFTGTSSFLTDMDDPTMQWSDVAMLSVLTGVVYAWETTDTNLQWILAGKGGRLGSLSVVASLLFWALHRDAQSFRLVRDWVTRKLGISTSVGIAVAMGIFWGAQENLSRLQGLVASLQQNTLTTTSTKTKITTKRVRNVHQYSSEEALPGPTHMQQLQRQLRQSQRWLTSTAKIVMVTMLLRHAFVENKHPLPALLESSFITFVCSLFLYQRSTTTWGGVVLPMSLIGLLASLLDQHNRHVATPMCVGGLIGMTRLPGFSVGAHLEASVWITLLLYNNQDILAGVGGRLGVFTVLAVLLAHMSWWWSPTNLASTPSVVLTPTSS